MKTIKAEFLKKTDAYNAVGAVRNLCLNIDIDPNGNLDRRNNYLSNLNLRHDFFSLGSPGFMNANLGFPQFNSMAWGSLGMNDISGAYDGYDGGGFYDSEQETTVLNIEVEDKNLGKLKNKLYSAGAVAVFDL